MVEQKLKSELRKTWDSAAPGWASWENVFSSGLAGVTDTLISMAGVGAGSRVLDVACGAGAQTIQAAKRVGPDGVVVASDISGTMLEHIHRRAEREGMGNIETLECAADDLNERIMPFDAATCRLGLMPFPCHLRRWRQSNASSSQESALRRSFSRRPPETRSCLSPCGSYCDMPASSLPLQTSPEFSLWGKTVSWGTCCKIAASWMSRPRSPERRYVCQAPTSRWK